MRFWSLVLVLYLAGATAAGYAQRPDPTPSDSQPTFRSAIDIVRLDVSVLDKERLPIRGLTAADFTVLEDGKVQSIVAFDAVDLPDRTQASASWMRDIAPDVVTNRFAAQRVIVVILDDFSVPLDPWAVQSTKTIARAVIDRMGPEDLAAVVYTVNQNNGQEFTIDRTRLLAAVDRFVMPFGEGPLTAAFSASERRPPSGGPPAPKPIPSGACPGGACVTSALRNTAETLRGWPGGRKTAVLLSPGIRMFTMESLDMADQLNDLQRTFAAMQEVSPNVEKRPLRNV